MNDQGLEKNVAFYALRLADSALTMGQRIAEWCGHGPYLEEDVALTNVSLDYFGHANMLYSVAAELLDDGRSADQLAFLRDVHEFKNPILTELPKGDFGYTMLKQYFMDCFNSYLYQALLQSNHQALSDIAAKAIKEVKYHKDRSELWVKRLAMGTEESRTRMQRSLDDLWFYTPELFETNAIIDALIQDKIAADPQTFKTAWQQEVEGLLKTCSLQLPETGWVATGGLKGEHSEHLGYMLAEMQFLQRAYPGCEW
ncbi:1,2-phenylacetyl-CoA epoxidase subunit PaaC [Marinicella sp. W31]|uniref:1,2-phenylacetyl-CoA epoxidase subunit PaaC n=1 Tax=Marinicella sp. W31 TaxID=3023713 RepID=UPI0037577282